VRRHHRFIISMLGGAVGFFIFHPLIMIVSHLMTAFDVKAGSRLTDVLASEFMASFSMTMMPWSIAFLLGGTAMGYLWGKNRELEAERRSRDKLQGVLEMAGAACHELNQPLQIVLGFMEQALKELDKSHPARAHLNIVMEDARRMAVITHKIMGITKYEIKDYMDDIKIVDIDKASGVGKEEA